MSRERRVEQVRGLHAGTVPSRQRTVITATIRSPRRGSGDHVVLDVLAGHRGHGRAALGGQQPARLLAELDVQPGHDAADAAGQRAVVIASPLASSPSCRARGVNAVEVIAHAAAVAQAHDHVPGLERLHARAERAPE